MEGAPLIALLSEKASVLRQLNAYTAVQQDLIASDRMTALLELLNDKQKALNRFGALQEELTPFLKQSAAERQWQHAEERATAQALHQECETLLRELLAAESASEQSLLISRARVLQQIEQLDQGASAAHAYDDQVEMGSLKFEV